MWFLDLASNSVASSSIGKRIRLLLLIICVSSAAFSLSVFFVVDILDFRQSNQRNLVRLADSVSHTSSVSVLSSDSIAAAQSLAVLEYYPEILFAGLYTTDGQLFQKSPVSTLTRPYLARADTMRDSIRHIEGQSLVALPEPAGAQAGADSSDLGSVYSEYRG